MTDMLLCSYLTINPYPSVHVNVVAYDLWLVDCQITFWYNQRCRKISNADMVAFGNCFTQIYAFLGLAIIWKQLMCCRLRSCEFNARWLYVIGLSTATYISDLHEITIKCIVLHNWYLFKGIVLKTQKDFC